MLHDIKTDNAIFLINQMRQNLLRDYDLDKSYHDQVMAGAQAGFAVETTPLGKVATALDEFSNMMKPKYARQKPPDATLAATRIFAKTLSVNGAPELCPLILFLDNLKDGIPGMRPYSKPLLARHAISALSQADHLGQIQHFVQSIARISETDCPDAAKDNVSAHFSNIVQTHGL